MVESKMWADKDVKSQNQQLCVHSVRFFFLKLSKALVDISLRVCLYIFLFGWYRKDLKIRFSAFYDNGAKKIGSRTRALSKKLFSDLLLLLFVFVMWSLRHTSIVRVELYSIYSIFVRYELYKDQPWNRL